MLSVSTAYTVTATNTGGSDTATVTIVVNDALPVITYSPSSFTLTKGTAMTTVTPTTSGGAIVSWSISPTLPTGLAFDTSTGAISGTPTVLSVSTAYTVTATNTGGSDTAAVTIVVNDALPVIVLFSKQSHAHQGHGDDDCDTNSKRWNDRVLVNFANVTNRPCL